MSERPVNLFWLVLELFPFVIVSCNEHNWVFNTLWSSKKFTVFPSRQMRIGGTYSLDRLYYMSSGRSITFLCVAKHRNLCLYWWNFIVEKKILIRSYTFYSFLEVHHFLEFSFQDHNTVTIREKLLKLYTVVENSQTKSFVYDL